jgi:hypothetical protein
MPDPDLSCWNANCIAEEYVREMGDREKMNTSRGRFRQSQWVV